MSDADTIADRAKPFRRALKMSEAVSNDPIKPIGGDTIRTVVIIMINKAYVIVIVRGPIARLSYIDFSAYCRE